MNIYPNEYFCHFYHFFYTWCNVVGERLNKRNNRMKDYKHKKTYFFSLEIIFQMNIRTLFYSYTLRINFRKFTTKIFVRVFFGTSHKISRIVLHNCSKEFVYKMFRIRFITDLYFHTLYINISWYLQKKFCSKNRFRTTTFFKICIYVVF